MDAKMSVSSLSSTFFKDPKIIITDEMVCII